MDPVLPFHVKQINGSVKFTVGLKDLKGLFQPKGFQDSNSGIFHLLSRAILPKSSVVRERKIEYYWSRVETETVLELNSHGAAF